MTANPEYLLDDVRHRGLPTGIRLFDVLGRSTEEGKYSRMLAWLLDPAGSHGLGDLPLRCFLIETRDATARRVALATAPVTATTAAELLLPSGNYPDVAIRGLEWACIVYREEVNGATRDELVTNARDRLAILLDLGSDIFNAVASSLAANAEASAEGEPA